MSKLSELLPSIIGPLDFPDYFEIGTTTLCNARCTYCPYSPKGEHTMMSDALFQKITEGKKILMVEEWPQVSH